MCMPYGPRLRVANPASVTIIIICGLATASFTEAVNDGGTQNMIPRTYFCQLAESGYSPAADHLQVHSTSLLQKRRFTLVLMLPNSATSSSMTDAQRSDRFASC